MSSLTGGTIASGTYYQTNQLYYQGSTNYSPSGMHQTMLVIDASQGTFTLFIGPNGGTGTYSTSGATLTLDGTCPPGTSPLMLPYTYSNGTLKTYDYTKNEVSVLTKQ